jgi:hypothetical protein
MPALQASFNELQERLGSGGTSFSNAGDDPVFYLVFRPEEMLEVKRHLKLWTAKLKIDGWAVHRFSMADAVHEIFRSQALRDVWLESEAESPLDFAAINATLRDALMADDALKNALQQKLEQLAGQPHALLLVTDLEALHPYLRVGSIEQKLQGKFTVPTVLLYPGIRTGKATLKFLGIYPEDGNYRSTHIGG